jgi:hypothetical protein
MNWDDAEPGMTVRVSNDISLTESLFQLDTNYEMEGMRGREFIIKEVRYNYSGKRQCIKLRDFIFAPEDLEFVRDIPERENFKPIECTFDPKNLFVGESKWGSKKKP